MSDWEYAEVFKALREEGRKKRAGNLENSLRILHESGIPFEMLSSTHARVGEYDYWPSTGLFIHTKTKTRSRGVRNLIKKAGGGLPDSWNTQPGSDTELLQYPNDEHHAYQAYDNLPERRGHGDTKDEPADETNEGDSND